MAHITKVFTVRLLRGPKGNQRDLVSFHVTGCGKTERDCKVDAQKQVRSIIRSIKYTVTPMLER